MTKKEYDRQRYLKNRERILAERKGRKPKIDKVQRRKYQRKWIARNKDKVKNYYAKNREKLKQYYTDNRDHILSRVNGYYQKKKREMIEKVFEKHMDIKDGFMRR